MRRNIAILFLSWATALTAASCGSATDTSTSATTTTAASGKATTTTTAKAANALAEPKCKAIQGYLQSYAIASKAPADAATQDKVLKGLNTSAETLTKAMPLVKPEVETITAYATKLVKADASASADKDAADKAHKKLVAYRATCADAPAGGGTPTTKAGGATPTTKAGAAKTTTTTAAP